jgi:hypothetical protein
MKHDTQKEIGELLEEISSELWNLSIDVDDSAPDLPRAVWVNIFPRETSDERGQTDFHGATLCEALGKAVDFIRVSCGKPTREEEIAALLAADASHAAAPPVSIGPDARCGCGSQKSLIVVRHFTFCVDWEGKAWIPFENDSDRKLAVKPGEIGTCPDCGRNYTFGA